MEPPNYDGNLCMASVFKQNTGIFYKCSGEDAFKPVIPFLTIFEDTKMNI